MNSTFISIGKISKPHGVRGVLKFIADYNFTEDFLQVKALFISQANSNVPYIVETIERPNTYEYLVKFEDIKQRETAEKLAKKEVFIKQENFDKWLIEEDEYDSFSYLVGFDLYNQHKELLGKIEDVLELPQHELAQLNINGKEVLIPLDENLIIEIDEEKQSIHTHIVDGLLDIYL